MRSHPRPRAPEYRPHEREPARPRVIPDAEIQELARVAWDAWVTGIPAARTDTQGGLWSFEPVRDEATRLEIERVRPQAEPKAGEALPPARAALSGLELGATDELPVKLASTILAVAAT